MRTDYDHIDFIGREIKKSESSNLLIVKKTLVIPENKLVVCGGEKDAGVPTISVFEVKNKDEVVKFCRE